MDGRIEAGFRYRLRSILRSERTSGAEEETERMIAAAREEAGRLGIPVARALLRSYEAIRERAAPRHRPSSHAAPRFLCDPSLGGLARWLRAAGYEAMAAPDLPVHRLPGEARTRGLVLVTTETEVLARRALRDGSLAVVWLPSALSLREQLRTVLRDLGLSLREPRCMACGGELQSTPKEEVLARIPPRTARWKDEYFVCASCHRLYWRGTHWERIARALGEAVAG